MNAYFRLADTLSRNCHDALVVPPFSGIRAREIGLVLGYHSGVTGDVLMGRGLRTCGAGLKPPTHKGGSAASAFDFDAGDLRSVCHQMPVFKEFQ